MGALREEAPRVAEIGGGAARSGREARVRAAEDMIEVAKANEVSIMNKDRQALHC
jgi:hypothetical protein